MTTIIHQLIRTINDPALPATFYRALCGHQTTDPKEFRKPDQPTTFITCEACLQKLGIVHCDGGEE